MTKQYRLAKGDQTQIRSYVKRSNELWSYAMDAYQKKDHDACAILVIHSCISLADAACIVQTGARYAGTSHDEAVQYFHSLGLPDEGFKRARRRLGQIIGMKTISEYGGSNLREKDAETIYKNGERFRQYLFDSLLKDY